MIFNSIYGDNNTAKVSTDCVQEMCQSWACVV